jgi:hypothetical protein
MKRSVRFLLVMFLSHSSVHALGGPGGHALENATNTVSPYVPSQEQALEFLKEGALPALMAGVAARDNEDLIRKESLLTAASLSLAGTIISSIKELPITEQDRASMVLAGITGQVLVGMPESCDPTEVLVRINLLSASVLSAYCCKKMAQPIVRWCKKYAWWILD